MNISRRLEAATLAVGTEITDGQITDRNSAWISHRLTEAGLIVSEHRAVPDDRQKIASSLRELSERFDLLFVTGGLGPTSDDFTRDLIAEVFGAPLEFHEPSWQRIVKRFETRGAVAKPIQRQQCFFPRGANILENPAGTANAFSMNATVKGRKVFVVALPGPPAEIAAVWELNLANIVESLTPVDDRENLFIWQTFGVGESEIAEKVEVAISGASLRVGYRAHLPYVEVKLWVPRRRLKDAQRFVDAVDEVIRYATVIKGHDDFADAILNAVDRGEQIVIHDFVSGGYLQKRLEERLITDGRKTKIATVAPKGALSSLTSLIGSPLPLDSGKSLTRSYALIEDPEAKRWMLNIAGQGSQLIEASSLYAFGTERGRKYAVEKAFQLIAQML